MKTKFIKSTLFLAIFAGLVSSCVNDNDYATPQLVCNDPDLVVTKQVSEIPATAVVTQYTFDDVIEAYVTSSDKGGNFYKSISFVSVDGTKGFSVPVDVTNTFTNFEPGRKVFIKMKDLYTDSPTSGAIGMRIGGIFVSSSGAASVGRLNAAQYSTVLQRSCTKVKEDDIVQHVTIAEAKSDNYINKLVEIDAVQFDNTAITKTYYDAAFDLGGATNWNLTDISGNSIIFRTSSFANFAGKPVATGRGKVRGVITKFGTDYQFIARTESDIQLTGERFFSFEETFTANYGLWTKFSVTGAEAWSLSTFGNPQPCALMNGFNGSARLNEDWLISPKLDLSTVATSATLNFQTASRFAGPVLQVLVSTDYAGTGNPTTATWTALSGFALDLNTASFIWTNSGNVDLSAYKGLNNVYLGFKYTSTTAAATTWEVDNVRIIGE